MTRKHPTQSDSPNSNPLDPAVTRRGFLGTASALVSGFLTKRLWPRNLFGPLPNPDDDGRPLAKVALAQANSYDPALVRKQVRAMLNSLGGLSDVVHPGDRVAIKINLTGGTSYEHLLNVPAVESYITHPEVVRALGEAVLDAGASALFIVEAVYELESWSSWGYREVAKDLGAELVNLNYPAPYASFVRQPVGDGWSIYEAFTFNNILTDIDVFMSVAKLKCHANAGVTLSMKNLVGLVPARYYRLAVTDQYRLAMHGGGNTFATRLPRVIVDLNRARPIHFALIDGIKSSEGDEGPWNSGWTPVQPGILIAGKNPVATDAVATAAMGFSPTARSQKEIPFTYCDNHLQLASEAGLGPHRLDEIEIVGAALEDVVFKFQSYSPSHAGMPDNTILHGPYGTTHHL